MTCYILLVYFGIFNYWPSKHIWLQLLVVLESQAPSK
jgi:hypothetical protein